MPHIKATRVEHKESGLASARREYLRLHRGKHAFDICAAPFGTGFFVSWWLTEPALPFGFLYTITLFFVIMVGFIGAAYVGYAIGAELSGFGFGVLLSFCLSFFGAPFLLWTFGDAVRRGAIEGERTLLAMPIAGWLYERLFAPDTFYSMDTALMFQQAVHNAVLEVIDCMTANKGIRALSEAERKPIMKRFTASV